MSNIISGNATVTGNLKVAGTLSGHQRTDHATETGSRFPINMVEFRVHDAFQTNLPSAGASDDLGLVGGTFATGSPTIQTGDLKAAGATTRYARAMVQVPMNYYDGESLAIVAYAGMLTTEADIAATLDIQAFKVDGEGGIGSDLYAGSAIDVNSLTFADRSFALTPTGIVPGDLIDFRFAFLVNDGASGTAVNGCIGQVSLSCNTRG